MNDKFDELTKGLAQSVTRKAALKRFGLGLAGMALALLGFPNKAEAKWICDCNAAYAGCEPGKGSFKACIRYCGPRC